MPNISEHFDPAKKYKELEMQAGGFVACDDFSWVQDMQNYDKREMAKSLQGFQLKINAIHDSPVFKVKADYNLTEGQVITLQMIDATHVVWRSNSGAWSASIVVVSDNVTYNTVGTSGLSVVFSDTSVGSDVSEVWVAQGMRLLGGALSSGGANSFTLNKGKFSINGEFEDFTTTKTVVGATDNEYLYLKVETNEVTYSTDADLGHRLADSNTDPKSPKAHNRVYTLMASANFPDNTSSPYVQYFILGKIIDGVGGIFNEMWEEPCDIQKLVRIYGDTNKPETPTGLTLTTGSELDFVDSSVERSGSQIPLSGFLTMSCDIVNEANMDYYEFKIVRLATIGGAITTEQYTQIVRLNTDNGGVGIPIGINFTMRNQTFGVPYGVFVRSVDKAGNVSSWSSRVDEVIGSSTCGIGGAVLGPIFTLTDTVGLVGVTVNITSFPASAEGYGIWMQYGSYPTATPGTEWGSFNRDMAQINIPAPEGNHVYIRVRGFDENGIYQNLASEGSINLAASAQLSTETHDLSSSAHGGLIGSLATVSERYGDVAKAFALIESTSFNVQDVYVVSTGGFYSTLQAALNAVAKDEPAMALILIGPNHNDSGGTVTFPAMADITIGGTTRVIIQGFGTQASITDDLDLSNLSAMANPLSAPYSSDVAQLVLKNVIITGRVYSTKTAIPYGAVAFEDCIVKSSQAGTNHLLDFDAVAGGGHYVYAKNSTFINFGTSYVMNFGGYADIFIDDCTICLYGSVTGTAIYFDTPSTSLRRITGSLIEVHGSTIGLALDSSGAINVGMNRCDYRRANGGNISLDIGTTNNNSVWSSDFVYS